MDFFKRLKLEMEDLEEEMKGLPSLKPGCRIGDFGCGEGFSTLCLMLLLHAEESIGIDKFPDDAWVPSCQTVQQNWENAKRLILDDIQQENTIQRDLQKLFSEGRFPMFEQGDILQGHNLPNNLDLVYCKKVLGNVYDGSYGNSPSGEEGLAQAIHNIATTLKQGGIFCAAEKVGTLSPFIEQAGFNLLRVCQIRRGEIDANGRSTSLMRVENCIVYLCQKS